MTSRREERVRAALAAYNGGDAGPLVATFAPNVTYALTAANRTFAGRSNVEALSLEGLGNTRFEVHDVIEIGPLLAYTYDQVTGVPGTEYSGPGLAVQLYDADHQLRAHWAFRSPAGVARPT